MTQEKVYRPKSLNENQAYFQLKDGYSAIARITKKGFFEINRGEFYDKDNAIITDWALGGIDKSIRVTFDTDGSIHPMWSCEINSNDINFIKTITSLIDQIGKKIKKKDYSVGSYEMKIKPINLSSFDIAKYILHQTGEITTVKLQRLLYLCQDDIMTFENEILFNEDFKKTDRGPIIISELWDKTRDQFRVNKKNIKHGNIKKLRRKYKDMIDLTIGVFDDCNVQQLFDIIIDMPSYKDTKQNEIIKFKSVKEIIEFESGK